jgi:hypothetical protein
VGPQQFLLEWRYTAFAFDLTEIECSQEKVDRLGHRPRHRIADSRVCGHRQVRSPTRLIHAHGKALVRPSNYSGAEVIADERTGYKTKSPDPDDNLSLQRYRRQCVCTKR